MTGSAGAFLAGLGYGGGCLPKDVRAFWTAARQGDLGSLATILGEGNVINQRCRARVVDLAREVAGCSLSGCRIAVLDLAFKPGSDDVRDSASLDVCGRLARGGALVAAHDPVTTRNAARIHPGLRYAESVLDVAADADLVLHLTEWGEYRALDPAILGAVVAQRKVIDARCALDEKLWRSAGWFLRILGRP